MGTAQAAPGRRPILYRNILERFAAVASVRAAGAINHLRSAATSGRPYTIEGVPSRPGPIGAPRGVPATSSDAHSDPARARHAAGSDAPGVVVINDYMARHRWRRDPIGRRIALAGGDQAPGLGDVVGVVKNAVRVVGGEAGQPELALDLQARMLLENTNPAFAYITFVARTDGDPAALVPALRSAVWAIDPTLPISAVRTMESVVESANGGARFQTLLLAAFAASAALLAAIGIYGVMSYAVSRQAREIGVRMALGANPGDVLRRIVRQGMAVAMPGAGAGLVSAFLLTRLMSSLLYGVQPTDPLTYAVVAGLLLAIALAASYVPARRAARLDPVKALRAE